MAERSSNLICGRCGVPLTPATARFSYMGHTFKADDIPRCPECGQLFVSEELAKGKMMRVETSIEDK